MGGDDVSNGRSYQNEDTRRKTQVLIHFNQSLFFPRVPSSTSAPGGRLCHAHRESKKETQAVGLPGPSAFPTCCGWPLEILYIYISQSCYYLNVTSLPPLLPHLAARQPLPGQNAEAVHITLSPSQPVHAHILAGASPQRLVDLSLPPTSGHALLLLKPCRCLTGRHAPPTGSSCTLHSVKSPSKHTPREARSLSCLEPLRDPLSLAG